MSELRSIVDTLRSEALADLPDARIEEDFAELHRAVEQLEVERLRRLAEIDRRGTSATASSRPRRGSSRDSRLRGAPRESMSGSR